MGDEVGATANSTVVDDDGQVSGGSVESDSGVAVQAGSGAEEVPDDSAPTGAEVQDDPTVLVEPVTPDHPTVLVEPVVPDDPTVLVEPVTPATGDDEPKTFLTPEAIEFFAIPTTDTTPTTTTAKPAEPRQAKTFGVPEIFRADEPTQFLTAPTPPEATHDPDDADTVVFTGVLDLDDPPPTTPEPTPDPPAPTPRRKNNPAVLTGVFTMILCTVLGLGLLSRIDNTTPVAGHPVAAPHTAALAPTSAEPVRPRPVQRLEDHPLLVTPRPLPELTCELPTFGTSDQQLADYYTAGVKCLDNAWGPVLNNANLPFEPPQLDAAPELSNGPCGAAPASEDAVAYYCGRNRMIYMPTSRLRENGGGDRPATHLATLAHEYGHHVQAMTGMLRAADLKIADAGEKNPAGLEMSRRIELQANCFAGMFLGAAAGKGDISTELASRAEEDFQYAMEEAPEKNAHGSPTNQGTWALNGYNTNSTNACNTYAAPAAEVS